MTEYEYTDEGEGQLFEIPDQPIPLSDPDLSAEEKTFAAAQVSKINGQAVHVDVHASAVGGAYVLHMHVRPLF